MMMLIYHQTVDEIILWIRILVQIKQILPPPPLLYRPSSPIGQPICLSTNSKTPAKLLIHPLPFCRLMTPRVQAGYAGVAAAGDRSKTQNSIQLPESAELKY